MPFRHDPGDCLADIIENADRVAEYLRGADYGSYQANRMLRDASERCLERICEAAVRLGDRAPELIPGQNWKAIRGMGNQLRHAYHKIDVEAVWTALTVRVPELRAEAAATLAQLEPDNPS